jgi:CubicO group peptidase (beta-lactamase class C family)
MRALAMHAPLAGLLLLSAPALAQRDPRVAAIDAYAAKARAEWNAPALALAIVKNDSIVFARGYGVLEKGSTKPVDEHTLFAIGSSTKAFHTAALAMLVDEGKIKWDDPASPYLPGWQLRDPWVTREVTIRDMVAHRIGLDRADYIWGGTDFSRDDILRRQRYLGTTASFRLKFGYNNHMFLASGMLIERLTGRSWDTVIRQRIFDPLGMPRSNSSTKAFGTDPNVATPHARVGDTAVAIPWHNIDNVAPAGSINSSAREMARWVRFQLANGKWQGRQLVSEESMQEMHSPQTVIPIEPWFSSLSPVNHQMVPGTNFFVYGLGWFLQDYRGHKVVQHGGSIDGMRALVGMIPDQRLGVVVLTNLNPSSVDEGIMFRVFDEYLGGEKRDWSADMLREFNATVKRGEEAAKKAMGQPTPNTRPSLALAQYAGTYSDSAYGDVVIKEENGKLTLAAGRLVSDLDHWHFDTFKATSRNVARSAALVSFRLSGQGTVAALSVPGFPELRRK